MAKINLNNNKFIYLTLMELISMTVMKSAIHFNLSFRDGINKKRIGENLNSMRIYIYENRL